MIDGRLDGFCLTIFSQLFQRENGVQKAEMFYAAGVYCKDVEILVLSFPLLIPCNSGRVHFVFLANVSGLFLVWFYNRFVGKPWFVI